MRLDQLGTVERGRSRHRPRNDPALYGGDYPFVQTGDVKAAGLRLFEYEQTYNDLGLAQSRLWPAGTLCFTIAANIGDTAILGIPACFPDSIVGFTPYADKADVVFVKYALDYAKIRFAAISKGATQDNLSLEKLLSQDLLVPPLEIQRRIAGILGAYDDLIEVNRRQIAVLEEMARGLFDEWFVRFRFPGHEGVAIEDTPDGALPAGWCRAKVGKLLQKISRPVKIQKQDYIATGGVPCIDQGANFIGGYTDNQEAVIASPLPMCVFGDHTRILKFITFPFASGADGTQLLYPTGELTPVYLYLALINVDLSNQHYARHFKFLKEQMLVVPPRANC